MCVCVCVCVLLGRNARMHTYPHTSPNLRLVKWKGAEKYFGVTRFPSPTFCGHTRPSHVRSSVHIIFLYIITHTRARMYLCTHSYVVCGIHRDSVNLYGSLDASSLLKPSSPLPQFQPSHRTNIHFSYNKICGVKEREREREREGHEYRRDLGT